MTSLTDRMKHDFKPYVPTVCPAVVDRLGDSHESVREKAQALLMVILEKEVLTPQQLFDRVTYSFSHKNSKVREEIMICLVNTINMYGSNAIALNKLTPHLVKLLADQNMHVREQALATLMEIYRRVGDRLRTDIQKKYASTINPSRLAPLMAKMDELRESGAVATTTVDVNILNANSPMKRGPGTNLDSRVLPLEPNDALCSVCMLAKLKVASCGNPQCTEPSEKSHNLKQTVLLRHSYE
ncbi:hypothetical protein RUM44_006391 [Polyplax serrata]|uniref:TOG domain-containing protein n=1 Tax=Polyplax serrata TaxID=468196 RepID=A0ABR1AHZ1_POLSC